MFSFFKKKPQEPAALTPAPATPAVEQITLPDAAAPVVPADIVAAVTPVEQKQSWVARLKAGLSKTSSSLTTLFVGAKIDDELYEELESALLMADAGVDATQFLLD
jgi:fused signal recognition particle receptor